MRTRLLVFLLHASVSAGAQCLDDYQVIQRYRAHGLSREHMATLQALAINQQPGKGWRLLADLGDPYAALAADVIDPTPGHPGERLKTYIHRHWVNTVGKDATARAFTSFAAQHFQQYVNVLGTGTWPDADQILNSYLAAARAHALPDLVVFDATWEASDYSRITSWQVLNHLPEPRRIFPSRICLRITRAEANASLRRDFRRP